MACGQEDCQLYFVKVDVKSCFDTIPQANIVRIMEEMAINGDYRIERHAEIGAPSDSGKSYFRGVAVKPSRRFVSKARPSTEISAFHMRVQDELAAGKSNSIFVDKVVQGFHDRQHVLSLLEEHVKWNVVKIGKKMYRQKKGIPQGSILSSYLCNFFYAHFERRRLSFLSDNESILLRLIDDSLLITSNREHAQLFLDVMHAGDPHYGIAINPDKSLVNFQAYSEGGAVPRLPTGQPFPYCGNLIQTGSLEISRDRGKTKASGE